MWPDASFRFMTCIYCSQQLTSFKISTIKHYIEHIHSQSLNLHGNKTAKVVKFISKQSSYQATRSMMKKATTPNQLRMLAPYKLTFTFSYAQDAV